MKNILNKIEATINTLIAMFVGIPAWINESMKGWRTVIVQAVSVGLLIIGTLQGYELISGAWFLFLTSLANLILEATKKPVFNLDHSWKSWMFWVNITSFGLSLSDIVLATHIINDNKWNIIIAIVVVTLRLLDKSSNPQTLKQ